MQYLYTFILQLRNTVVGVVSFCFDLCSWSGGQSSHWYPILSSNL